MNREFDRPEPAVRFPPERRIYVETSYMASDVKVGDKFAGFMFCDCDRIEEVYLFVEGEENKHYQVLMVTVRSSVTQSSLLLDVRSGTMFRLEVKEKTVPLTRVSFELVQADNPSPSVPQIWVTIKYSK